MRKAKIAKLSFKVTEKRKQTKFISLLALSIVSFLLGVALINSIVEVTLNDKGDKKFRSKEQSVILVFRVCVIRCCFAISLHPSSTL